MFPLRDHNPSGSVPYVTFALIAVNAMIFLGYWLTLTSDTQVNWFFFSWGLVPENIMRGTRFETVLTSMFLHAGWMHILGNMWFLWIFGDNLEDEMGHGKFLGFYLLSGAAAAALQVAMAPYSPVPMVGASGAIAGVMGGYLLLFPKARVDVLFIFIIFFRIFAIPAWIVLMAWLGIQVFSGVSAAAGGDGVAYWAHVGGFAGGLALALPALLVRGGRQHWQQTEGHPQNPSTGYPPVFPTTKTAIPRVPRG